MKKDKRVDDYIAKAQPFAQPILKHLRTLVHNGCPDIIETIKWSFPNFDYKGKILCSMAAFKQHCSFNLWLASHMHLTNKAADEGGMGIFGKITSLKDLPPDEEIMELLHKAMALTDAGKTIQRKAPAKNITVAAPEDFLSLLNKNKEASEYFAKFSPSKKKEYIEWVTDAKTETTRAKRMATAVEWIAEGKSRNWKYEKK